MRIFGFLLLLVFSQIGLVRSQQFNLLSPDQTGIGFSNDLPRESSEFNYFSFNYIYNGAGVAVFDFDRDGKKDVFFTGNDVLCRLYRQVAPLKFVDVTARSGIENIEGDWVTGVTVGDVDADGWPDLYVCRSGPYNWPLERLSNLCYRNNGDGTFTEQARERGIADPARSTHATFFDYDGDGDLDLFTVNHSARWDADPATRQRLKTTLPWQDSDHLFRNEGNGMFSDVTAQSGIANWAFGLSVVSRDLNGDGWTDLYVANDYEEPDDYWINNGDGTFSPGLKESFMHISNFSMGSDAGDINNDGHPDLIVLDMMAEDNRRRKVNMSGMDPQTFYDNVNRGHHYQYMQNSLQLNHGNGTFGEVAELAGVAYTDWSWAALLEDLDADGWQDLYITNGYRRDIRNNDQSKQVNKLPMAEIIANFDQILAQFPVEPIPNYAFRNRGNLRFEDMSEVWGLDQRGFSQGAAITDLDDDGDLDIIVNQLDAPALIYENQLKYANWLTVRAAGPPANPMGIGLVVEFKDTTGWKRKELNLSRGYLSSMAPEMYFGLGDQKMIDEIKFIWPDGKQQVVEDVKGNRVLIAQYSEASQVTISTDALRRPIFQDVTRESGLKATHQETIYDDFQREVLLPHKYSQLGPALAVTPLLVDKTAFLFLGGAAGHPGQLWREDQFGRFTQVEVPVFAQHADQEDVGAAFFDADGDGDLDLYVGSGSNEWEMDDARYRDRLYRNVGNFRFEDASALLPPLNNSSSVVRPADFDGDGDLDLLIGGRVVPGKYPYPASSVLLVNEAGQFRDGSLEWLPEAGKWGMVTDAVWEDLNHDGKVDLLVSGEWMAPRVFLQGDHRFVERDMGWDKWAGWGFALHLCDPDGDGDTDIVAGYLGENSKYQASPEAPFMVHSSDLDGNGMNDVVLSYEQDDERYPVRGRQCSSQQIPELTQKFPNYESFASASLIDVYGEGLTRSLSFSATNMASLFFENLGEMNYEVRPLPVMAQLSAGMDVTSIDLDGDGKEEVVLAGNFLPAEVETARHDAAIGTVLHWKADGEIESWALEKTDLFAYDDVRVLELLPRSDGKHYLLIGRNDGPLTVYLLNPKK